MSTIATLTSGESGADSLTDINNNFANLNADKLETSTASSTYAPKASPTFTGTVVLPSTTSIGTVSNTEIGYLDGVTSAIQTQIDGKVSSVSPTFTGTVVLPSTTSIGNVSATEIGYIDGVTSAIQTQIDSKQATITGGATTIASSNLTASRALASDGSGKVAVSSVTATELGYVSGVTSAIQTQINNKGVYTFSCGRSNNLLITAATTAYGDASIYLPSTETDAGIIIPYSGTMRNLYVDAWLNNLDAGSAVFTLMKNGVATSITVTVAFGVTSITGDTTHTVSVTAGDRITLRAVATGSTGACAFSYSFFVN